MAQMGDQWLHSGGEVQWLHSGGEVAHMGDQWLSLSAGLLAQLAEH